MDDIGVVLIVAGDQATHETLAALLGGQGYRLAFAGSGAEALGKAVELAPDLILLDAAMPGPDSFELCRRLRADPVLAPTPILMMVAADDHAARLRGLQVGSDDFVTKSLDRVELQARVRMVTRLNRRRHTAPERTFPQQVEEEIRRRNLEIALLNYAITAAASTLDVKEVLRIGCDVLTHIFDISQAIALALGQDQTQPAVAVEYFLASRSGTGQSLKWLSTMGETMLTTQNPIARWIFELKIPLVATDAQTDPRLAHARDLIRERGLASVLILPIPTRDRVAGIIELNSTERREFGDQDLILAQSVATAIGQAVEVAQLYQKLQQYADHLEEIVTWRTLELQTERDRTQSILEALGEAVVVTDIDGIIHYVNPAAVEMSGFSVEEAVGQKWLLWQGDFQPPEFYAQVQELVRAGQTWRGEVVNRRKNGSLYNAAMTVAPLFDPHESGRPVGFVSVQRDITPLKEAERLKDQFVSNVSHELRTPLSVITLISGNLDTLYERLDERKRRKLVRDIREHAQVLNELIGRVLEISRIDSRRISMERRRVNLAQLARQEIEKQLPLARKKTQVLRAVGVESLTVLGNDGQLRQVLRNLLNNAIKYTPEGGRITCECAALSQGQASEAAWPGSADLVGQWAAVRVVDTGIGINPQDLARVFERFFRVEAEGSIPGTGLGLSIARELIKLHGGHIAATSTPGEGSLFAIYLPLVEDEQ